jgi:hypothetical protein
MDLNRRAADALKRLAEVSVDPRNDPFATLFAGRTKREREQSVMTHFYYAFARGALNLVAVEQLPEGQDPPDYRCIDSGRRRIGVELVELVDEDERQTNCYRRGMVARHGKHEHSLDVPPGSTPGYARLLTERPALRNFSVDDGLMTMERLLATKDQKLARRRRKAGSAWGYDQTIVLIWTTNWSINLPFFWAVKMRRFGPFDAIDTAFLVPQPFIEFGDAIIDIPLVGREL